MLDVVKEILVEYLKNPEDEGRQALLESEINRVSERIELNRQSHSNNAQQLKDL